MGTGQVCSDPRFVELFAGACAGIDVRALLVLGLAALVVWVAVLVAGR